MPPTERGQSLQVRVQFQVKSSPILERKITIFKKKNVQTHTHTPGMAPSLIKSPLALGLKLETFN